MDCKAHDKLESMTMLQEENSQKNKCNVRILTLCLHSFKYSVETHTAYFYLLVGLHSWSLEINLEVWLEWVIIFMEDIENKRPLIPSIEIHPIYETHIHTSYRIYLWGLQGLSLSDDGSRWESQESANAPELIFNKANSK